MDDLKRPAASSLSGRNQLILHPDKRKWLISALILFVVFLLFLLQIVSGHVEPGDWGPWILVIILGPASLGALVQLVPGLYCLKLDSDGITVKGAFGRQVFRWNDIVSVSVKPMPRLGKRVALTLVGERTLSDKLSAGLFGGHRFLPDTYGHTAESLAKLIEQWHRRFSSGQIRV